MKPRIALLVDRMDMGGIQRVTADVCAILRRSGVDVDLVTCSSSQDAALMCGLPKDVDTVLLTRVPIDGGRIATVTRCMSALWAFIGYYIRNRPSAIIAAGTTPIVIACWLKAFTWGRACVLARIDIDYSESFRYSTTLLYRFRMTLFKLHLWIPDRLLVVSDYLVASVSAFSAFPVRNKIRILRNPVNLERIRDWALRPVDCDWFSPQYEVVISVAGLHPRKNHPMLLRSFAMLLQAHANARLLILGDGVERSNLERLSRRLGIDGQVRFLGNVPNPYPYMARSRVLVLPSYVEGLATVTLESLVCATPVLLTNHPGARDVVDKGPVGEVVQMDNDAEMAAAMSRLMRRSLDDASVRDVVAPYSWDTHEDALMRILTEVHGT